MSTALKINELRNLSTEELREKENGLRKELMQLRFQAKTGKLERASAVKEARRNIARLLTVISEQRLEQTAEPAPKPAPAKKEKTAAPKAKAEAKKVEKKKTEAKAEKPSAKTAKTAKKKG